MRHLDSYVLLIGQDHLFVVVLGHSSALKHRCQTVAETDREDEVVWFGGTVVWRFEPILEYSGGRDRKAASIAMDWQDGKSDSS